MKPSSETAAPQASRRRALYAGVATVAALAGAGLAWRRLAPQGTEQGAEQGLWSQQFETPDGAALAMASFKGQPLLLNFWATWCPPCIEELPMLNTFYRQVSSKGWQVVGLAVDQPSSVRKFLARSPLDFPVGLAGLGGADLARSLGNLVGGLPFTVVFGADGQVRHRKIGQLKAQDLQQWAPLR